MIGAKILSKNRVTHRVYLVLSYLGQHINSIPNHTHIKSNKLESITDYQHSCYCAWLPLAELLHSVWLPPQQLFLPHFQPSLLSFLVFNLTYSSSISSFFSSYPVVFESWTQGFVLTRQNCDHWATFPNPFNFSLFTCYFCEMVLLMHVHWLWT